MGLGFCKLDTTKVPSSQNHKVVVAGEDLWGPSSPTCLLE